MSPLTGGGSDLNSIVTNLLKSSPDDSVIQVSLLCSPDFNAAETYVQGKNPANPVLHRLIQNHKKLIESSLTLGAHDDLPILNVKTVIMTLAIPVKNTKQEAFEYSTAKQMEFQKGLKSSGFNDVRLLNQNELVGLYRQFINIYEPREAVELDPLEEIRFQVYGPDDKFDFRKSGVGVFNDKTYVAGITPKSYPSDVQQGIMNFVIGAPMNRGPVSEGGGDRVKTPFIINTTLRVANQKKEAERIAKAIKSRSNDTSKMPIKLGIENQQEVLADLNFLQTRCSSESDKYIFASMNIFVFGKTEHEAIESRSIIASTLDKLKYDARTIQDTLLPRFIQTLPLNFSPKIAKDLDYEVLAPASSFTSLLPIYADHTGNADRTSNHTGTFFFSRRSSGYFFDPYRTNSNKNGALFATSGAGKSFLIQYMIVNDLAEGTHVMAFDNGLSLKKLAIAASGNFVHFEIGKPLSFSLNPFNGLTDQEFDEQQENITNLILQMAFESESPSQAARIAAGEAVKAAWGQKHERADIPLVISALESIVAQHINATHKNDVAISAQNLVPALKAFMDSPSRGSFFRGNTPFDMSNPFIIFEMKGLEGDSHLRQCVMFFVMNMLMTKAKSKQGRKKIIVDEAADLLRDDGPALVMEGLYRKGRKDEISVWVVSQSPRDMASNRCGQVILSQSAWKLVMMQEPEEVDKTVKEGIMTEFSNDSYFNRLIKDVQTVKGSWSEVLICGLRTYEVVRLYVDRFASTLFSSEGDAREGVFSQMDNNVNVIEAVENIMGESKTKRKAFINEVLEYLIDSEQLSAKQAIDEIKEGIQRWN